MTPRALLEPARLVDMTRAGNDRPFEAIVERYRRPCCSVTASCPTAAARTSSSRRSPRPTPPSTAARPGSTCGRGYSGSPTTRRSAPRAARSGPIDMLDGDGDRAAVSAALADPAHAVESRERLRTVVDPVKQLPDRQRAAILLRELEGRSYEENAAELGVGTGAVRQRSTARARPCARRLPR